MYGVRGYYPEHDYTNYDATALCAKCGHARSFHQSGGCIHGIYSLTQPVCSCGGFELAPEQTKEATHAG